MRAAQHGMSGTLVSPRGTNVTLRPANVAVNGADFVAHSGLSAMSRSTGQRGGKRPRTAARDRSQRYHEGAGRLLQDSSTTPNWAILREPRFRRGPSGTPYSALGVA